MEDQLSKFFNGKKMDLRTPNDLSRYFRNKVISNVEVLYAGSWPNQTKHMLDAAKEIISFTKNISRKEFENDWK